MKKSIFGIPKDSFVEIIPIDEMKTEIKWTTDSMKEIKILEEALYLTDYDFRLFELLNFDIKSSIITMNFNVINL
jgi:hypothetical protein